MCMQDSDWFENATSYATLPNIASRVEMPLGGGCCLDLNLFLYKTVYGKLGGDQKRNRMRLRTLWTAPSSTDRTLYLSTGRNYIS